MSPSHSAPVPATRAALLTLTPDQYLEHGLRRADGTPWPELRTTWALAAAQQLRVAGISARQFNVSLAKVTPVLLAPDVTASAAAEVLERATGPTVTLFLALARTIHQPDDAKVAAQHLAAVLALLGLDKAIASAR
jgi:hypothetical protein